MLPQVLPALLLPSTEAAIIPTRRQSVCREPGVSMIYLEMDHLGR